MLSILFSWLKQNYIDLLVKVIPTILSIILIILRSCSQKKLKLSAEKSCFLEWLPSVVHAANSLYPERGSGSKKFAYVVAQCSMRFASITLEEISSAVESILNADKKGGDVYEESSCSEEERQKDIFQNCKVDVCSESTQKAVPRRYTVLKK